MEALSHGQVVDRAEIARAVTAAPLRYGDGARQVFEASGKTTYTEAGSSTHGTWSVQDGRFSSFWPPSYRAWYDLRWIVEDGAAVGLTFVDQARGSRFDGRYER
ncbi:hypothetical protein [Kribbella sp. NPDC051137]|uniref:hypothetical protein n=1 Tax=Kribbella sp. NPDC051137 TaxID=3155045 RepID=UPI0034194D86